MKLVVGGYGQGKATFACEKFGFHAEEVVDGREVSLEELVTAKVVSKIFSMQNFSTAT